MMKERLTRRLSRSLLMLGMVFLILGIANDQTELSWLAIAFVLIALVLGSKWWRSRK